MGVVGRVTRHAQNLLEVARYGGLRTGEEPAPYDVAERGPHHRLRHYTLGLPDSAPSVLLVPPLMVSTELFDVSPGASAVRTLAAHGVRAWVVDFGAPETEPGGLERTFEDHVLAIDSCIDHVREATGADVHLVGYSQGGMFCYQACAFRRSKDVASIAVFGSPVDIAGNAPMRLPAPVATTTAKVAGAVLSGRSIPGWMTRTGFRALDPIGTVTSRIGFYLALHDRDALLPREGQRRFLLKDGWVAWPGPALDYFLEQFVVDNRMLAGGFSIAGRAVSLTDIDVPVLTFVGEVDEIAQAGSVRSIRQAAPKADVHEVSLRTGHFGLVVGTTAMTTSWPVVAQWALWREGRGPRPDTVQEAPNVVGTPALDRLEHNVGLAAQFAEATGRRLADATSHPLDRARRAVAPAVGASRLTQVTRMRGTSQISLGQAFERQARSAARSAGFLFEGQVYDYATVNDRVERLLHGLARDGVRPGEHVGVLMDTRPTGLALVTALNRLGAVAVLVRPDGDASREAALGRVSRVYADPANAPHVPEDIPHAVVLLAGGQEIPEGVGDLEVDPREVPLPADVRRNPGRADDLAFVLFTGVGSGTRALRITNGRWALTAYGTATSAALTSRDTLLSLSPMHHPAGLLTAIGGAVVGGARLAMVNGLETTTFWEEARRYGVTVVSYTWSTLAPLVEAAPHPAERDHRVRLFLGSGLPRGLWHDVVDRFAPARVLEFWASTEGGAILANVSGSKVGSVGRPLPGGSGVRLAQFDRDTGELVRGPDGYALRCRPGEVGLLMVRERDGVLLDDAAVESDVFHRGDRWVPSTSLFRRDQDGDHWFEGGLHEVVHTAAGGVVAPSVAAAFEELDPVRHAVAYGLPQEDGDELLVVAVELRDDLDVSRLTALSRMLPAPPSVVHVVDRVPLSSAGRPLAGPTRARGLDPRLPAYRYHRGVYVAVEPADLDLG